MRTRIGPIELIGSSEGLVWLQLPVPAAGATCAAHLSRWFPGFRLRPTDVGLGAAVLEVQEWDAGRAEDRTSFPSPSESELVLDLRGTPFQVRVWEELRRIPAGSTTTYGELAAAVERPQAARAIGSAMRCNPVPLLVPCHRVLSSQGLGGFSGNADGAQDLKRRMLSHEGVLLPMG